MRRASKTIQEAMDAPYALTEEDREFYRINGFVKLSHVLSPTLLSYMDETITSEVKRLNTQHLPIDQRDTYGKAFLQIMNLWTRSESVKEIVFGRRLAKIAADLMGVEGVRLYHDQALYKEPAGGHTPWHADQYYWPLSTDKTVTAWIPLQDTPLNWGPIEFSAESYKLTTGRNLKIGDESQKVIEETLKESGYRHVVEPFALGDVSFHSGWLFHRAGPNRSGQMRKVMTMIYMDKNMTLKEPENENQVQDWETWCPGAVVGKLINTPLNPILYP